MHARHFCTGSASHTFPARLLPPVAALLVLLALLLLPAPVKGQTEWRLEILESAIVRGEVVRLGEIAKPLGNMDQAHWQQLAATELFPAPQQQLRPMSISGSKLQAVLQGYLGEQARYCIVPHSIAIQRGGSLVPRDELVELIVNTLTPKTQNLSGEPEFRDFRVPGNIFLRDATHSIQVEPAGAGIKPGRVSLRFREVALDGSVQRSLTGSVQLDVWREVPVAVRPLNRGDEINDATVRYERKNIAFLRSDIWTGQKGPWRVKGSIGKGQVIYRSNLESLPLVTKGDTVRLVYNGTNIQLEVPGEALDDGAIDQSIPVRNMQSNVQVYAKVLDSETVQVF